MDSHHAHRHLWEDVPTSTSDALTKVNIALFQLALWLVSASTAAD
jgi:hypothetical protein